MASGIEMAAALAITQDIKVRVTDLRVRLQEELAKTPTQTTNTVLIEHVILFDEVLELILDLGINELKSKLTKQQ